MISTKRPIIFYVDESYAKNFLGISIVIIDGIRNQKIIANEVVALMRDPIFSHYTGSAKFHYVSHAIAARQMLLHKFYQLPLSAYIAYKKNGVKGMSKKQQDSFVYETLLPSLLDKIARKHQKLSRVVFKLNFEQLSSKKGQDKVFFKQCIQTLKYNFEVAVIGKNDLFSILPDYFLGIFCSALTRRKSTTWPKQELQIVEDKIGLIVNASNKKPIYYDRGKKIKAFIQSL
ncbi:MAG: hypothetical protein WC052_03715 [Patescibacteria group bacterium]